MDTLVSLHPVPATWLLCIPVKTATDSGRKLPPVPAETCHPIPALL